MLERLFLRARLITRTHNLSASNYLFTTITSDSGQAQIALATLFPMSPLLSGPGQLRASCSFRLAPTDGAERLLATEHVVSHSWFANMMLDEIYVKKNISYKGGKIVGADIQSVDTNSSITAASTIQTFTISSIQCGNYLWNKFNNFKTNDICRKR
jgi:hypothetical protein